MSINTRQRTTLALIKGAAEGKYTVKEIALRLNLSERRIKQIKKAFKSEGDSAVIHGNKGRKPSNAVSDELRGRIAEIKRKEVYSDMNFSHFNEYLESDFGIRVSYKALHSILKEKGFVSKKSHRRRKKQLHRHRERRACFGEMLQADAASYRWLGTDEYFSLHGFIDDATSKITALYMSKNECLQGYLEVLRSTVKTYGLPMELYMDRAGVFSVNDKNAEFKDLHGNDSRKTQFGRMLGALGINPIFANSPQAKGRVERMWNTLQDRLTVHFKKNGIKTVEQANEMLPRFIKEHNAKFSVRPAEKQSSFVQMQKLKDLDALLAVKHERITDRCGAFSFMNLKFQVVAKECMANKKITFMFSDKIGLMAECDKKYYPVKQISFKDSIRNPVPEVVKDLLEKCCMANAHSPNYKELA
ncbi:MAG: ISNCY family transposase [Fibromonadales bacterium]|nr:ISNCY family transposase [Fibromonadales bacterium]